MGFRLLSSPLRSFVALHSFGASALREIQEESFEREFGLLSSQEFSMGIKNGMHFTDHFITQSYLYCSCLVAGCIGLYLLYGPQSSLQKLDVIDGYDELQRRIQFSFFLFLVLFFRNVENAI